MNLENVDIYTNKLSEGLGRCPKNPQGTSPLTHFVGSAHTCPNRKWGKEQELLSLKIGLSVKHLSRDFRGISSTAKCAVSGIPRFP